MYPNPWCPAKIEIRTDWDTAAQIVGCKVHTSNHTEPHKSFLAGGVEIWWRDALNPATEESNEGKA